MEPQKTQKVKIMLRKQKNAENITCSGFKLYYKAIIIKTIWDWHKKQTHTDQQSRSESPEINPQICGELIYDKEAKNIQWRKDSVFNKWC